MAGYTVCHGDKGENEFPSRLGLNKVSYCIGSLKLEYIFSGEGEKRSVFVGMQIPNGISQREKAQSEG
jgi:hypothetical protein